jgi:hypothetical protein
MNKPLRSTILLSGFLFALSARAENVFAEPAAERYIPQSQQNYATQRYAAERQQAAVRAWKISLVPVVASQSLDIASSYGMRELNPMLAGPDGTFGTKAMTIKLGATAAVIGVEYLIVKKWPGSARVLSKVNWGTSALTTAFAVHNYAIK